MSSSSSETLNQVSNALDAMYGGTDVQADKVKATQFLESFQKSQEAWEIVHIVLHGEDANVQLKLFAAQTLRSKVTYDLHQLPETNYPQLKESILELLVKYSQTNQRLIRTQLAIALSHLSLQYLTWVNAVNEIIGKLSAPTTIATLLEVLKILPEELSDVKKTNLTDDEFNQRTTELITSNVEPVLLILKNLSESGDNSLNSAILDCLNNWIKECPVENILHVDSLTSLIFKSLSNDETFEKAIECLVTIIHETRDIENQQLIDALYQQILQLDKYLETMKDDPEAIPALTRLYVECGEAWHVLIAKNPAHFKPLCQILLQCCKYKEDLDVVKYTFYFWYLLKQLLTLPKFEQSKQELREIYQELIVIIISHLSYPIGPNDNDLFQGDKEQEDKFKEFRYEMGDVLKDCCAIVGATKALEIPFRQIQSVLLQEAPIVWQHLEAPLFSMRAMAKEVPLKENTILPVIMSFLVQLPEHPKIRYAATLVLGRYSEWTSKNPQFLEPQLNYITKGFEVSKGATDDGIIIAASRALMYFCQDCSVLLVNYLEQLYMLYGQVKDQLDLESTFELVDGLAHVISKIPQENMYKTLEMFITPTLNVLIEDSNHSTPSFKVIADQVEILTIFVQVLKCPDFDSPNPYPIAELFMDKIYPISSQLLSKFGSSIAISESNCKLIKSAIQSFSFHLNKILADLANLLVSGFKTTNFGCYLWVSGVLIREFGDDYYSNQETKESIHQFGLQQCFSFFEILSLKQNEEQLKQIPDVIEDFFRMMNDLLMFYPLKLISNFELLTSTLNAVNLTLTVINEFDPIISCVHFLIDFISWGMPHPPISLFDDEDPAPLRAEVQRFLILNNNGCELLRVVLNGLIFRFHNDVQQDVNDLILKILVVASTADPSTSNLPVQWLQEVVTGLPNSSRKEIDRLINTVSAALPNKDNRKVRSALRDFVSWYSRKNVTPRSEF